MASAAGSTFWLALAASFLAFALLALPRAARADTPIDLNQLRLERVEDAVYLSANVDFDLPAAVEDALYKGLPIYFVAEADLFRDRWYWYDRKVASATRYMRLAWQPLSRRWRVVISPTPIGNTGLGQALGQTFETLPEALFTIQRLVRWKIADAADVELDTRHNVEFRFRLDTSQLPRPLQIGTFGQNDWNIAITRNVRLALEVSR